MSTTITCKPEQKQEIKEYLLRELGTLMEDVQSDKEDVEISETADTLEVEYPNDEVYGATSSYVYYVPEVFEELKKNYRNIGISGVVYAGDNVSMYTWGTLFHCSPEEEKLTITEDWQYCASCHRFIEEDTFYNSAQWDTGGYRMCLCCPTCMLDYALTGPDVWGGELSAPVFPNDSITKEEAEMIEDADDEDDDGDEWYNILREIFWKRITGHLEEYMDDFRKNKEHILILPYLADTAEQKAVLLEIADRIRDESDQMWEL